MEPSEMEKEAFRKCYLYFRDDQWSYTSIKMNQKVADKTWNIIWNNLYWNEMNHRRETRQEEWWSNTVRLPLNTIYREEFKYWNRWQLSLINRCRMNRLELAINLNKSSIINSPICQHCEMNKDEDAKHHLFECPKYEEERNKMLHNILNIQDGKRDSEKITITKINSWNIEDKFKQLLLATTTTHFDAHHKAKMEAILQFLHDTGQAHRYRNKQQLIQHINNQFDTQC